jgi:hypothetical protein
LTDCTIALIGSRTFTTLRALPEIRRKVKTHIYISYTTIYIYLSPYVFNFLFLDYYTIDFEKNSELRRKYKLIKY